MDSNKMTIVDDNGEEKEVEILFTFDSPDYGKQYVVFSDPAAADDYVYVWSYDDEGNMFPVENEDELQMAEELIAYREEHDEEA
mgnify:CR=1 FL=1